MKVKPKMRKKVKHYRTDQITMPARYNAKKHIKEKNAMAIA